METGARDFCPRTPGYWKNHLEMWPVSELSLGGMLYGESELLGFLQYGGSDMSTKLARQLVAAKLNLASGSDLSILPTVADSDAFLVLHPPGSDPHGGARDGAEALKDALDAYNNTSC